MPRRNSARRKAKRSGAGANRRKHNRKPTPLPPFGSAFELTRRESGPGRLVDEEFCVRNISGGQATKWYRCPGCDQEIPPGVAHIVAWPADYGHGVDDRRHWHTNCWKKRATRGITRRWG